MEARPDAVDSDRERFSQVIGRPMLALEVPGRQPVHDPGAILDILSGTVPGQPSTTPTGEKELVARLTKLKNSVRQQFADIGLPGRIVPKLVCWMELRKESA